MKAIVFGAGKIARGFIGQLLYMSGFAITFVDANAQLVSQLQAAKSYHVYVLGNEALDSDIDHFQIYHVSQQEEIAKALHEADVAFVSVGGNNLAKIGACIAEFYSSFGIPDKTMNFVACENYKNSGKVLRQAIEAGLDAELLSAFTKQIGVSEAVIMRTATQPTEELAAKEPLNVWVQDFWYLPINAKYLKGNFPVIQYTDLMDQFGQFLIQKMYTNNTSNAVIAYNGYLLGYDVLAEAANSAPIAKLLDRVYEEINDLLVAELGIDRSKQEAFAKKARAKYTDWTIVDRVIRHGKDPIRKLGPDDRLIAPARLALRHGIYPNTIIDTIAKALFFDETTDEAAQQLKQLRQTHGVEYVLKTICQLDEQEQLYEVVVTRVAELRQEGILTSHE